MKKSEIDGYQDREKEIGKQIADQLLRADHTIRQASAIYPEYVLARPFGLHRPGVNVGAMIFLYRQVVAYVPPITRAQFADRFGVSYESFLRLAYPDKPQERFLFPVLNHPRKYRDQLCRTELAELLLRMPPTWERWHSALRATGGTRWFDESDKKFNYKGIWAIPDLRGTWRARLQTSHESVVSREIKQQIRNNYTDLCLVGREDMADEIAKVSHSDPESAANDLFYSSDLYAYPSVMGAGGSANMRATRAGPRGQAPYSVQACALPPEMRRFDAEVVEAMFEGLKFNALPKELRLDFLLQWHRSSQAEVARSAYAKLLKAAGQGSISVEELHAAVKRVLEQLQEFCAHSEPAPEEAVTSAERSQDWVVRIATIGGLATTIIGIFVSDILISLTGGALTLIGGVTWFHRDRIIRKLLKRHAPEVPEELYKDYKSMRRFLEQYLRKKQLVPQRPISPQSSAATSCPVRTFWWSD